MMEQDYVQTVSAVIREVESTVLTLAPAAVERLIDALVKAKRVFFAGAGRSRMMLGSVAMRLMHIGLTAHAVSYTHLTLPTKLEV